MEDSLHASKSLHSYRIIVSYDGTDYHGWQQQRHCSSITQVLQDAFKKVFHKTIAIVGASRTDAGVHAAGQVALFTVDFFLDPHAMREAWNKALPLSVVIRSIMVADSSFHPQRNVQQKTYYYHVFTERPLPFLLRYGWYYGRAISLEKLRNCLQVFVGTHDFRSFCTLYDEQKSTVRTIDAISVEYVHTFKVIRIIVQGHSFLHYMIRRIVGAAVTVASQEHTDISVLTKALAAQDPQQSLPKAPAHGLLLYKIQYKDGENA